MVKALRVTGRVLLFCLGFGFGFKVEEFSCLGFWVIWTLSKKARRALSLYSRNPRAEAALRGLIPGTAVLLYNNISLWIGLHRNGMRLLRHPGRVSACFISFGRTLVMGYEGADDYQPLLQH